MSLKHRLIKGYYNFWRVLISATVDGATRVRGEKRVAFGKLVFGGAEAMRSLLLESLEILRGEDAGLWEVLTEKYPHLIWYERYSAIELSPFGYYSIPPGFVAWGTDGVVAALVYWAALANLHGQELECFVEKWRRAEIYREAKIFSAEWLRRRGFPEELAGAYERSANK